MLCSKLHCQKCFNLNPFSYTPPPLFYSLNFSLVPLLALLSISRVIFLRQAPSRNFILLHHLRPALILTRETRCRSARDMISCLCFLRTALCKLAPSRIPLSKSGALAETRHEWSSWRENTEHAKSGAPLSKSGALAERYHVLFVPRTTFSRETLHLNFSNMTWLGRVPFPPPHSSDTPRLITS